MSPNTSGRRRARLRGTAEGTATFACPACDGRLRTANGSMQCADCGYVPRHGAD